jgi:hypothetical protein
VTTDYCGPEPLPLSIGFPQLFDTTAITITINGQLVTIEAEGDTLHIVLPAVPKERPCHYNIAIRSL